MKFTVNKQSYNLHAMNGPELVQLHNQVAEKPVKKFSDVKTAIKRTEKALREAGHKPDDEKPARKKRGMHFRFPTTGDVREVRSADSLRGRCVALLEKGATFEDIKQLVLDFDADRGVEPKNVERRAYELTRIMHYYLGYGVDHDLETGVIRLKQ